MYKVIEYKQPVVLNLTLVRKIKQTLKYEKLWFFKYVLEKNNRVDNRIVKSTSDNKESVQIF